MRVIWVGLGAVKESETRAHASTLLQPTVSTHSRQASCNAMVYHRHKQRSCGSYASKAHSHALYANVLSFVSAGLATELPKPSIHDVHRLTLRLLHSDSALAWKKASRI